MLFQLLSSKPLRLCFIRKSQYVCIILFALTLSACGFQLRGSLSVSNEMAPVFLQKNSVFELAREIKSLLGSNKIQITENVSAAKTQLTLVSELKNTRVLSVDGSGQAKEYLLTYTANISIKTDSTEAISDSVTVRRDLVFNTVAVLGFTNEAEILYKDMRKQAARLILLKLQAVSRNSVSNDSPVSKTKNADVPTGNDSEY